MANIIFSWELGGGNGHAGRLKSLAQPLAARGHRIAFALRDLVRTRPMLHGLGVPVFQAPLWLHRVEGLPPAQASLAEILLGCGYIDPMAVAALVDGWRALLQAVDANLVVADYAPAAVLAARSLGIPSASVGACFALPPAGAPLPSLRAWEAVPLARLEGAEARLLDSVNRALAIHGARPLARACDALLGDTPLLCTWPELDPYRRPAGSVRWFGPNLSAPGAVAPRWPAGEGQRVFAYLGETHPEHVAMLEALARAGCRTLVYAPHVAAQLARSGQVGFRPPVAHPLLAWAAGPVDLTAALPGCAFAVCHAGDSTISEALLAGVPLLMMPRTTESFLNARRVRELGAGININEMPRPLAWNEIVRRLLQEPGFSDAAHAFAERYAGYDRLAQAEQLARVLEGLIA
jgi:UDP:flavonoid glycosyltransferase YjiC (YdhE family)